MDPDHVSQAGDAEAARWYARLRAPACSSEERQAFHAWLQADPAHALSYERALIGAQRVTRQLRADPELQAMLASALNDRADAAEHAERQERRWTARLAMGGVAAIFCAFFLGHQLQNENAAVSAEHRLVNDSHARREVRLEDGSLVTLDVGSELMVHMDASSRRIQMRAGRAFFEVAHDESRPFSVEGGGTRTTALGTRFEVNLRGDHASVTLAQGSVAVVATDGAAWSRRLTPGEQLVSRGRAAPLLQRVDMSQTLGWSTGRLHFDGAALNEVVKEWNRYASVHITVGDGALADSRIVGTFRAGGDSNEFVTALASVLPIRAVAVGAGEILLVRDY